MIKIVTRDSKILGPDGKELTGYLKITPVEAFEYQGDDGSRKKILNNPVITNFVNGRIIEELKLAPTSNAGNDKEGIYYKVEYIYGSNSHIEYWDIDGAGSGEIEITDINQVIIDNNQIIHKCDNNKKEDIRIDVLSRLDFIHTCKYKDILDAYNRIDSINIIDIGDSFIFTDGNNIVRKYKVGGGTDIIYPAYAHQYTREGDKVYGVCPNIKKIFIYDITTQEVSEIDLSIYPGAPWGLDCGDGRLYVGMHPEALIKIDIDSGIIEGILSIYGVSRVAYYSDGLKKRIYAPQEGMGKISIINATSMQKEGELIYDGGSPIIYRDDYIYLRSNEKIYKIDPIEETIREYRVKIL